MKSEKTRKIFSDAVDLFGEEPAAVPAENAVVTIALDEIRPFDHNPFRLYEGERLNDMIESIREHGVLVPVIVRKVEGGYQMLAGHNRMAACRELGLKEMPAIVKEGLTDEEAFVYLIETNVMQRSFSELLPSEKGAVLSEQYEKVCGTMKREEIIRELELLSGKTSGTSGHDGHQYKTRDIIASEYGFSSRSAARYIRVNHLIDGFKDMLDDGRVPLVAAVELSYLQPDEQERLCRIVERQGLKLNVKMAAELKKHTGSLTDEKIADIIDAMRVKKNSNAGVNVTLPKSVCEKYFSGMSEAQMMELLEAALSAFFQQHTEGAA